MPSSEFLAVALFCYVVTSVYFFALVAFLRKRRGYDRPVLGSHKAQRVVVALAMLGTLCILYGALVEPFWPEVTRVHISSPKIPETTGRLRIVHISDLHSDPFTRLEGRLPDIIRAEGPDLIVFSGDTANSKSGVEVARRFFTEIAAIAPTFAVRGNGDVRQWNRTIDLFGGTGVVELRGESRQMNVRGAEVVLLGTSAGDNLLDLSAATQKLPALTVALHHFPDEIENVAGRVDLLCAGHTHGGQIALPFYGALTTQSLLGKKYEAGLYHVEGTWMYVNRGIGMTAGGFFPFRFWARPEVTVIEVSPLE